MSRAAAIKAKSSGPPPLSLLPGQSSSTHLHGFVIEDGTSRVLSARDATLKVAGETCRTGVRPQAIDATIHTKRQVDESVEAGWQLEEVDLLVNTVGQPMQEHIPLRLLVPLACDRQGAKFDGVIRQGVIPLLELRQLAGSLLAGHGSVEDPLHLLGEGVERGAAWVSVLPHRRSPQVNV